MPVKDSIELSAGTLYIDGEKAVIYEANLEQAHEYVKENLILSPVSPVELTGTLTYNKWLMYKICGFWDMVLTLCPNKRVAHLARHGKNKKVIHKNFHRAIKIVGRHYSRFTVEEKE